ncbi:MAG: hypothetical protein JOY68_00635, partial [Candidatus Dormibacteraeota bacterium]|nr:hypothetical protein [Candidatus Dormibacteraeota bacterium]
SNPSLDTSVTNSGTWLDETDIRPTILAILGLKDDYTNDGRVLTEDLTITPGQTADPNFLPLARCYKQLNSSVGRFGTDVLSADTTALATGSSSSDSVYTNFLTTQLQPLGVQRDADATQIKTDLWNAEFNNTALPTNNDLQNCNRDLAAADALAAGLSAQVPETPLTPLLPFTAFLTMAGAAAIWRRRQARRLPT